MSTENVAVLFTDMVGSTAIARALEPDAADDLRRAHFSILRQAVADAHGTEVKNLGDGLMVVFTSTSAALSCAAGMQQAVERDNRARDVPVGLRVGLSGGEVTREDDDYFGDPVIEAARLCAACDAGQILAADVVRAMAGRRSRHVCVSIGPLSLKGYPDPVDTVEVRWEPLGESAARVVPLPGRLSARPAAGVVGRVPERAKLLDALERVAGSERREVFLISGEAGMGKTTLVGDVARAAFDAGACVLFGHCEEDLATPYQLFAEAFGHYVTYASEDELVAHVVAQGAELARLVPALSSRLPGLPPSKATDTDTERYLLFAAAVGLLAQVSQHQPVVLVLDDLQWADQASLQLLRHVAAADQPLRLLVLGTYRDSELSRTHPLLDTIAALHRQPDVARLELAGLDDAGVVELMEAVAGHTLVDAAIDLARAVHRETDGNPFFVSEVLRHLAETGAVYQDAAGHWVADGSVAEVVLPASVREVIGARVGRLGRDAERVLSMAAVIGRDFDLAVLARAAGMAHDDLLDVLEAAASVALVREVADAQGRYNFAHALIQHTLYEDLGPNRRAQAHQVVAEALEALYGDRPGRHVAELARHWFRAPQPANGSKALRSSRQAADRALNGLAPADALEYYAQATDLFARVDDPDPVLGIDLAIGLGTSQRQTGDAAFRETLLDAARRAAEVGDTERLVAAALANDRGWVSATGLIDADKVEILELALARVALDDPNRALVLATLCSELTYGSSLARREALADEAVAIAYATDDDAVIVRVLNNVAFPLGVPPLLEQSLIRSADALLRAERLGDPVLLNFAATWRAIDASRAGDIAEVDRCIEIAGACADQLDQPAINWGQVFKLAWRALIAGDDDDAEQLAARALEIGTGSGQPDAGLFFGVQLVQVSAQRGTLEALVPVIEQAIAENPTLPSLKATLASAHIEAGRIDEARPLLQEFAAADFQLSMDPIWLIAMTEYAAIATECRDPIAAGAIFERLLPWAAQWSTSGIVMAQGPVSHYLGCLPTILGRHDDAETYFNQALPSSERADARFFVARTNLSWGQMLAERDAAGDVEQARARLTSARTVAAAHGYADVERRAALALQGLD